jgi:hypothetical protein
MIHGAHVILYSRDADADRAFFRDVLKYPSVDAGHGWLIFALPKTELAVHPAETNDTHELYFMCEDVRAFVAEMKKQDIACSSIDEQRWDRSRGSPCRAAGAWGSISRSIHRPDCRSPAAMLAP